MRDTERKPWSIGDIGVRLFIFAMAALLLMALQVTGQLEPVQSFVTQLTSPAQVGTTGVAENMTGAVDFLVQLRTMRQRNAELENINSSLVAENFELREVERENQWLREQLSYAQTRPGLDLRGAQIVARVIGRESNNFLEYIMLDLGQRHGVRVGMSVITDQGYVGRISEVTESTSKVLLINDPSSAVNAILQSSRLNGVVRGTPSGDLVMDYIPQGEEFSVGEAVLTSGLGGRVPRGIPIGQVVEIRQRDIDVFQQAVVHPTVNFPRLELVMVVTNFDPLEDVPDLLEQSAETVQEAEGAEGTDLGGAGGESDAVDAAGEGGEIVSPDSEAVPEGNSP